MFGINFFSKFINYLTRPIQIRWTDFKMFFPFRKSRDKTKIVWNWDKQYNRIAVINHLLGRFNEGMYLEIGCHLDELFNSIPTLNKVGVDPNLGGNYRVTSDEFFKENDKVFDVIFIDGLHTYQQCRTDFINSLEASKVGSWIVLHDLLPETWMQQHVPKLRIGGAWTGDVWKLAFEIYKTPGLDFSILELDHGVGVCRVNESNVKLFNRFEELKSRDFSFFYRNKDLLPIIGFNEFRMSKI